jgi:RNA polymerase sigma factor (sigma-70 family)
MGTNFTSGIPKHLVGDGFIVPNAPPFGAKEERIYIEEIKRLRQKAFDKDGNKWEDNDHADDVAEYENARHELAVKYSFAALEIAKKSSYQCHRGMGFDDLFDIGFGAILNTIDKWPPFIDGTDKGFRLLTSIKKSINNAIYRFLDENNRPIRIPSYKLEQITIKFKENELKNPKKQFHKDVVDIIIDFGFEINDYIGRSLKDMINETGQYAEIAYILNLDVPTLISIVEPTSSIDIKIDDEDNTIADLITQKPNSSNIHLREILEDVLDEIPKKNATMIRDYFFNNMSMSEIASKNGYSKVRASQMINKSINKITLSKSAMNMVHHRIKINF